MLCRRERSWVGERDMLDVGERDDDGCVREREM